MGKKKTNAAKKKQVTKTKKNRLSSAYGVSVLKGGTKSTCLDDANSHAKNPIVTLTNGDRIAKKTLLLPTLEVISNQGPRLSHFENDEFQRQHASLEERSLALQARKDEQRRGKRVRTQQQKKGWGKFAQPSATNFAPATLTLAPKTTQELVDDATNQVAVGMAEIGQCIALDASAMHGQSTLAAAAGIDWKLRASYGTIQLNAPQHQNNPYAALDIDSDSDLDRVEAGGNKPNVAEQFRFNPASFSFKSTVCAPGLPHNNDDIDPDL
jgi:hypothetical protein